MGNADQHSFSGLETRGAAPADRVSLPSTPLSSAAALPDATFSGQSTHSGSTSSADLEAAADDLIEVEFEFVELSRHYDVQGELGQGGMGVVYRAFDRQLQRPVAIKRLKPELVANRRALARFLSEALAVASLRHENIVQIYRLGRDAVGPFLVLELVEGESLATRLTKGKLDLDEAIRMFLALAGGISLSHRHGIIHRDIKPGNILLTLEGVPKLSDFGIARRSNDSGLTSTAAAMGTLYYMAPEQHRDARAVTEQSDLYSLGATFYHAVTGEPPQVIREQRLPDAVRELTLKALESEPANRHPSVAEFAADLRAAQMQLAALTATTVTPSTIREGECPACHVINPSDRKFCKECGEPLTEACRQCQKPTPVWDRFCADCGADISAQRVAIEQDLADKARQVETLSREKRYVEALALVQPIESLSAFRWHKWKTWAAEMAALLHTWRNQQIEEQERQLTEAREQEAAQLLAVIKQAVKSKQWEGLHEKTGRLLELRPDREDIRKLHTKLEEREAKRRRELPVPTATTGATTRWRPRSWRLSAGLAVAAVVLLIGLIKFGFVLSAYFPMGSGNHPWTGSRAGEVKQIRFGQIDIPFVWCPPGKFLMGSLASESGRDPDEKQFSVELTRGFWLGQTEVTQELYQAVMGTNPSIDKADSHPVENVSWHDAIRFCEKLSEKEKRTYRLPTEAEWEYACRGQVTDWPPGGNPAEFAWFSQNSSSGSHHVGKLKPNPFGLYDMLGNVSEWCSDWYESNYYSIAPPINPSGPANGNSRIYRGGQWDSHTRQCRPAYRGAQSPSACTSKTGFRVVLEAASVTGSVKTTAAPSVPVDNPPVAKATPSSIPAVVGSGNLIEKNNNSVKPRRNIPIDSEHFSFVHRYQVKNGEVEFFPADGGQPPAFAKSKESFSPPISVTFEVVGSADACFDIFPNLFEKLSFTWGTSANDRTEIHIDGDRFDIPHTRIKPNQNNTITMSVDKNRLFAVILNRKTVFSRTIDNRVQLKGPILLGGGVGHVKYTSVYVEGVPP